MIRTPVLLLLVAILLIGAVGAFYWSASEVAAPIGAPGDAPRTGEQAAAAAEEATQAAPGAGLDDLSELLREDASVDDGDAATEVTVQVWDREPGTPGAEAEVFVLEGGDAERRRDPFAPTPCELAIARGRRYVADRDGRLRLRAPRPGAVVAARSTGASGFAFVGRRRTEIVAVTMQAEETITVMVVDAAGRPVADAPVGVLQRVPEKVDLDRMLRRWDELEGRIAEAKRALAADATATDARRRLDWLASQREALAQELGAAKQRALGRGEIAKGQDAGKGGKGAKHGELAQVFDVKSELKARRRTDARGLAVFRHFQLDRHRQEAWWPDEHRDRFEAVLLFPTASSAGREFAGRPVPDEVIELRMPPTGSVALRAVDRDGRPFTHPVHGELRVVAAESPEWARLPLRKSQDEVELVYPMVGLGMTFEARCRLDDEDFRWTSPTFVGPQAPGERVTVDLVVAPDAGMLHGRVLTAEGAPMGGEKVTFLINSIRGRLEGEDVQLDRDGRFHLPYLVRGDHAPPFRLQLRDPSRAPVPGVATTLPLLPDARVLDVGDLQLGGLQRIARGVVVDDRGEPVVGAQVQLQREREVGGDPPRLAFRDEAFTAATTDDEGRFALFGDLEHGRYRLRATGDDLLPHESDGVQRDREVVLRMERKARVVGTVLKPAWMPAREVRVRLVAAQPGDSRDGQLYDYRDDVYIWFDWVRPGAYDVELYVRGFSDPFLAVRGLQVPPGQHEALARLVDLDLRGLLYRFEVVALDDAGAPMMPKTPLLARVQRPTGEAELLPFPWQKGGRVDIVSASPQLEVVPYARGYHAAPRVLAAGESVVRFAALPPLQLHTPGLGAMLGATPGWLGIEPVEALELGGAGRDGRDARGQFARMQSAYGRLEAGDVTDVAPLRDGRYRVTAYLGDKARGGIVRAPLGDVDVRLVPGAPAQRLTVAFDVASVQQAAQEAAQRMAASTDHGK